MKTTTVQIEGMSCAHCVQHVEGALKALSGVTKVKADLKKKHAVIEHDDAVSGEQFKAAIVDAGFEMVG